MQCFSFVTYIIFSLSYNPYQYTLPAKIMFSFFVSLKYFHWLLIWILLPFITLCTQSSCLFFSLKYCYVWGVFYLSLFLFFLYYCSNCLPCNLLTITPHCISLTCAYATSCTKIFLCIDELFTLFSWLLLDPGFVFFVVSFFFPTPSFPYLFQGYLNP